MNANLHYWFLVIPFLIGAFLCGISGIAAGVYLFCLLTDYIVTKILLMFNVYSEFLAFVRHRAVEKRKRQDAEKTA